MYGLKSSRSAFRDLIAKQLREFGYRPSISEHDVWMIPAVKPGGFMYYECVICYVDDVICISYYPICTMKCIQAKFKIKGYKIE